MRRRQFVLLAPFAFLLILAYSVFRLPAAPIISRNPLWVIPPKSAAAPRCDPESEYGQSEGANVSSKPIPGPEGIHPMSHLLQTSERKFEELKNRQSKTLGEAVQEYRRRYGIPPPPNFDKWFEFARKRNVQMIDEYDMIHEMMTPFWGLKPATIRSRATEALGYDNKLLGILIREHNITYIAGGHAWMRESCSEMLSNFAQYLPDMDLAFNVHDEPRVVLPHDDLSRLVRKAKDVDMAAAAAVPRPVNSFTERNVGVTDGRFFEEIKISRFNVFPRQSTWSTARMACSPSSPARVLEEDERADGLGEYGMSELSFVYNVTAMADICLTPSLSETYGFFEGPNAYNIVHDLFPIFSQSKISTYSDIIYPSPWYWSERVPYEEKQDPPWAKKIDKLYWRGSTTGGYSKNGGWRRQHRQQLVQKINAVDQAKIYVNRGDEVSPRWEVKEVPRGDYKDLVDVFFSHVGQCDRGDCQAQKEFFQIRNRKEQEDAWKYKYLLDMDGNAFSGRFHAFLRSKSLVFKFTIFREWHFEWLKPWVHYIPLSIQANDWLEAVRYFGDGLLGQAGAEAMAMASRDWALKVLRREDMEVWFFRLLLEYGRVIDDNRANIGFS